MRDFSRMMFRRFLFCVIIIVLGGNYGKFHFSNGSVWKRKITLDK